MVELRAKPVVSGFLWGQARATLVDLQRFRAVRCMHLNDDHIVTALAAVMLSKSVSVTIVLVPKATTLPVISPYYRLVI